MSPYHRLSRLCDWDPVPADLLETGPGAIITAFGGWVGPVWPKAAEAEVMRRVINEADIWPPNSVSRRRRRTTRIERLLRFLQRALPSRDPWDWGALADAASRDTAAQPRHARSEGGEGASGRIEGVKQPAG
jgi:hypothetical protein